MAKTITIKLTKISPTVGPFTISDQFGNIIATDVSRHDLVTGMSYTVDDNVTMITLESTGSCKIKVSRLTTQVTPSQLRVPVVREYVACVWRHLTTINTWNHFYGNICPYIIEYPFSYNYQDEILQNVKDYTKAYRYFRNGSAMFTYTDKVETNDYWFNKAVLYNGQQSSGILILVPKPRNNMKAYMQYPKFEANDKQIIFTKSDNFYQYNTFWNVVKDKSQQLFITSCESLSIDKEVNQDNMDYTHRSFRKDPLRAKELKVRHILDDRYDIHLVSQFIVAPAQISYK